MRIDIEYIKNILDIVQDHDEPDFSIFIDKIKPLWFPDNEKLNKLVFHMEIMEDQGLIENTMNTSGIGFQRIAGGAVMPYEIPLRLTASGHQFASDLSKPGVIKKLTTTFKDAGPIETVKVVFSLGKSVIDRKFKGLLEE